MHIMNFLLSFFIFAVVLRILSVVISFKNERALKRAGAVEYGRVNTIFFGLVILAYYILCFLEGFQKKVELDFVGLVGIILYLVSMFFLFTVVHLLGRFWTIKLIIAKDHQLNHHFLFKYVRHPNYFLNVIPEIVALGLVSHAWMTMKWILPLALLCLVIRVVQEEKIMKQTFKNISSS